MISRRLFRFLVPDAPAHRRTDRDPVTTVEFSIRAKSAGLVSGRQMQPGLQKPRLVSSFAGAIDAVLLAFPEYGVRDRASTAAYQSLLAALRPGTRFVVVHHDSVRASVESWFAKAGHAATHVTYVPLPDYVAFTDWAEDGYVAVEDAADGMRYLIEPWEFPRAGDALIADAVEEFWEIRASQSPLIFQGGNCLVGSDFWLLGKDYLADSVALLEDVRRPVDAPPCRTLDAFARELFADYVDSERRLIVIGTRKPIGMRAIRGTRAGADFFVDVVGDGAGTFQPIFHIDMFVTLAGPGPGGGFDVLVGSPALGEQRLGTKAPFALQEVYDDFAEQLSAAGLNVRRNPLVHRPTIGRTSTIAELRAGLGYPDAQALADAIDELLSLGATETTPIRVRSWHHVTWNNCLVENGDAVGRHVYLPTFGHGANADLQVIDRDMAALWESMGFTVHALGDFNSFARRQGVVHCIKKYLQRVP